MSIIIYKKLEMMLYMCYIYETEGGVMWKSVFKLAIPVAIQSIMFSLFNIFDQIMVGTLGTTAVV